MVEHNLAKVGVEGSNPFARSKKIKDLTAGPGAYPALRRFRGKHWVSTRRGDDPVPCCRGRAPLSCSAENRWTFSMRLSSPGLRSEGGEAQRWGEKRLGRVRLRIGQERPGHDI